MKNRGVFKIGNFTMIGDPTALEPVSPGKKPNYYLVAWLREPFGDNDCRAGLQDRYVWVETSYSDFKWYRHNGIEACLAWIGRTQDYSVHVCTYDNELKSTHLQDIAELHISGQFRIVHTNLRDRT